MDMLEFVETNRGPVARRKHEHAENLCYTQIWKRNQDGDWKPRHYYTKDRSDMSSGLLEALYQGARSRGLPYEDFW